MYLTLFSKMLIKRLIKKFNIKYRTSLLYSKREVKYREEEDDIYYLNMIINIFYNYFTKTFK